ncbi:MAG: hypothetical protein QG602_139 [Verrucomicrobiota bacterium]|nr:hypothetical protein [Verrucomicrobiota bacterium]
MSEFFHSPRPARSGPPPNGSFAHDLALQNSSRYLPISDLSDGCLYLAHARNSHLGIWDSATEGFVILREKIGRVFIFVEFHWDTGAPFGTVKPFIKLTGPVAKDDQRKALDEAQVRVPYERFMEMKLPYF